MLLRALHGWLPRVYERTRVTTAPKSSPRGVCIASVVRTALLIRNGCFAPGYATAAPEVPTIFLMGHYSCTSLVGLSVQYIRVVPKLLLAFVW